MVEFSDTEASKDLHEIRVPITDRLVKEVLQAYLQLGAADEIE